MPAGRSDPYREHTAPRPGIDDDCPEELAAARRRVRASRLCSTSSALCAMGVIPFVYGAGTEAGYLAVAVLGTAALLIGGIGLVELARVGTEPRRDGDEAGFLRLSSRMARRGRRLGWLGTVFGGATAAAAITALLW